MMKKSILCLAAAVCTVSLADGNNSSTDNSSRGSRHDDGSRSRKYRG